MNLPLSTVRKILTDLGYEVFGYQAMGRPRRYHCERLDLAKRYNLPIGGNFDLAGLKAFCVKAVGTAGCTALPVL